MRKDNNPFFIGWEEAPAKGPVRFSRLVGLAGLLLGLLVLGVSAVRQKDFEGKGTWNFTEQHFQGIFLAEPYPTLISGDSVYYVAMENKEVLSAEASARFHLNEVEIAGSVIEDPEQPVAMIAVADASALKVVNDGASDPLATVQAPRAVTLRGEIADSKCALGAMNPGVFKVHRACAINCLSGGLPPVLIVRHKESPPTHYLLISDDTEGMKEAVLEYAALPVSITGEVTELGSWKMLKALPAAVRLIE